MEFVGIECDLNISTRLSMSPEQLISIIRKYLQCAAIGVVDLSIFRILKRTFMVDKLFCMYDLTYVKRCMCL